MYLNKVGIIMFFFLCGPSYAHAISPSELFLFGKGDVYYMGFIKVYEASLFGTQNTSREQFLTDNSSRCLKLDYKVKLTASNFVEAAESVLKQQRGPQDLSSVRADIDLLHRHYQDVEPGDSYTLCYDGSSGESSLRLNDKTLISIDSTEFANVYFDIWLHENEPLSNSLRKKLLSGLTSKEDGS